jgi:hypothetical protein
LSTVFAVSTVLAAVYFSESLFRSPNEHAKPQKP